MEASDPPWAPGSLPGKPKEPAAGAVGRGGRPCQGREEQLSRLRTELSHTLETWAQVMEPRERPECGRGPQWGRCRTPGRRRCVRCGSGLRPARWAAPCGNTRVTVPISGLLDLG